MVIRDLFLPVTRCARFSTLWAPPVAPLVTAYERLSTLCALGGLRVVGDLSGSVQAYHRASVLVGKNSLLV